MIELEKYTQLARRLRGLISEAKKCQVQSIKLGLMGISDKSYNKKSIDLNYNFAMLHKQENMLLKFIKEELPDYVENECYSPSEWHGKTYK